MLDKSLPYYHVIMRRPRGLVAPAPAFPQGYVLAPYEAGADAAWAAIEAAVGEFESPAAAQQYFRATYLPHTHEVERRVLFCRGWDGAAVGTVTAWWDYTGTRRDASLHWLGVLPEHQGQGLGTALVGACLERLQQLEGDRDIYLHTQTWSHTAIAIYQRAGFQIVRERFAGSPNDFDQAVAVLRTVRPDLRLDV